MAGRGILALDAASVTGWAWATPRAIDAWPDAMRYAQPEVVGGLHSGFQALGEKGDMGALCHGMETLLAWLRQNHGVPAIVARETPFVHPRFGARAETQILYGLAGVITAWAHRHECQVIEVAPKRWRALLTGNGDSEKGATREIIKRVGIHTKSDDEADAVGVLNYAIHVSNEQVKGAA